MNFTENQIKGNWGEQYVAERLSACGCLVHQVPQGHDCGIDLYCESIYHGKPFLHFWFQVKTSKEYKSENDYCSYRAGSDELEYWLSQPIPVFIVLVPDEQDKRPPFFICPIIPEIYAPKVNDKTFTFKSMMKIDCNVLSDLSDKFLNSALICETFVWDARKGKVSFLKNPEAEYVYQIPTGVIHVFEEKLKLSLRLTLWRLSEDLLSQLYDIDTLSLKHHSAIEKSELLNNVKPYIQALEVFVRGKNIGNYENIVTIGLLAEIEANYPKAEEHYQEAIDSIQGDSHFKEQHKNWKDLISKIQGHLNRIKQLKSNKSIQPT